MPVSALPNKFGIGGLGEEAFAFVDWLKAAGQRYWQILPINLSDRSGCPYAALSSFGIDPLYLSLSDLAKEGLLTEAELRRAENSDLAVDYPKVRAQREPILRLAASRSNEPQDDPPWLEDYAVFAALTKSLGPQFWRWPFEIRHRTDLSQAVLSSYGVEPASIAAEKFYQRQLSKQWFKLKRYAASQGIRLIGDMPIFVNHHSLECWLEPKLFSLNDEGELSRSTGAPPDPFNANGQSWGTPSYNWGEAKSAVIAYWLRRAENALQHFDLVRIDHFLGLVHTWEIPRGAGSARSGRWVDVPGDDLLSALRVKFPALPFIAEDLGEVDDAVFALRDKFGLPGMKVTMFAFGGEGSNVHLPEQTPANSVAYTGTHDTDTLMGWFGGLAPEDKTRVLGKVGDSHPIHEALLRFTLGSPAALCMIPIQDVLGLGSEARFNVPGTDAGNWLWRVSATDLSPKNASKLGTLTKAAERATQDLPS